MKKPSRPKVTWSRRSALKALAAVGLGVPLRRGPLAAQSGDGRSAVLAYLGSLARSDGGYGWEGQEHSHLTPTFAVIGCYRILKATPPNPERLAAFVRTHPPSALKKLEQEHRVFDFQEVQALVWLGEDVSELRERVRGWTRPVEYMKAYERSGYPVFQSEAAAICCRELLGLPTDEVSSDVREYLLSRRRANGTFHNTPAVDGSDGHGMSTGWGLRACQALGLPLPDRRPLVAWLQACQLPTGGFTYCPRPELGGVDDGAYTWAAVGALRLLEAEPRDRRACVSWVVSLANDDGGFADRPGWRANPLATFYALETLESLGALEVIPTQQARPARRRLIVPSNLEVFSIQLEAHGQGSPTEAVDLAQSLRIHLWGAKNAKPGWIERAQEIAEERKTPVRFFVSNEEYGTWVRVPGFGTYSHLSDIVAPLGADVGPAVDDAGVLSWPEFRERRLAPLEKGGGRLIWQFGENEELVRLLLDDSLERGGYAAISTYHFGNPDFTNSEPFLHRWRDRIPFVALLDAHGPEAWWGADVSTACRTLFLGAEPTWEAWLQALRNNWVGAVRRDAWTGLKTWMHAGSKEILELFQARETDWRWWDNPANGRPLVSLVAVRPEDRFERARPESGVTVRVRCAWECTPQGLLKRPLAELVKLTLDGREVSFQTVAEKRRNGLLDEHHHALHIDAAAHGPHTVSATVRAVGTGAAVTRSIELTV